MSEWVFDVADDTFDSAVIERSKTIPVVVDFWAPWCGPCRILGPLLERLVAEHAGQFALAKVNVDECPRLASAFGIQSIPMVLGIVDGQVAHEFVGALPESAVRQFLSRILPSASEKLARQAEELYGAGKAAEAETAWRKALGDDPRCDRARVGLARVHADRKELDEAITLLNEVAPGTPLRTEADQLAAAIRVGQAGSADEGELRARVAAHPDDLEARFVLAQVLAAKSNYEDALDAYLEIVRRDRTFRDDGARRAMLDIFALLGTGDQRVERYRSELAKVLFR